MFGICFRFRQYVPHKPQKKKNSGRLFLWLNNNDEDVVDGHKNQKKQQAAQRKLKILHERNSRWGRPGTTRGRCVIMFNS